MLFVVYALHCKGGRKRGKVDEKEGGGGGTLADGGREGAGGRREGAEGGREGGGSQGGGGSRPCTQVEAFKWPKCAPPC